MEINTILDFFPLWGVFLITIAVFVLSIEVGHRLARYQRDHSREVNVIRTAFLRAGLQPEPITTESRALLREYIDVRLIAAQDGKLSEALARSEQLQAGLWEQAKAAAEK